MEPANTGRRFLLQDLGPDDLKGEIGRALAHVFADSGSISAYFTDDYVQTTDGVTADRRQFEEHVRHVVGTVQRVEFEVLDALQQGDRVADRHLVHVEYRDGRRATIEVYLFGTVADGRLHRVHEITRVISGDQTLKELASARG